MIKKRILIIGGYGNFGSYISKELATEEDLHIIIAGRTESKCKAYAKKLGHVEYAVLDIHHDFKKSLHILKPDIVIHTSGPFQGQGYDVAKSCIEYGCHYIDLADGRDFVSGISQLDSFAKKKQVSVISGASSVPCLSSAIIDEYIKEFKTLKTVEYGIATAQQTNRGLATTASILSYTGKPFEILESGQSKTVYGWQNMHFHKYPELGHRALSNCDIPDLSIFPERYPDLENLRFYAGTEISAMHTGLWCLSWLVRFKIVKSLEPFGKILLKIAHMFDWLGSSNSAFHMTLTGVDNEGKPLSKTFYLLAKDGDGPFIPCAPSIILAKRLARGELNQPGAYTSAGLIDLKSYIDQIQHLNIQYSITDTV